MPPVKNPFNLTSYGGIIRIRLKGRSLITSSQPAYTSSPVFIYICIIYLLFAKCNTFKIVPALKHLDFSGKSRLVNHVLEICQPKSLVILDFKFSRKERKVLKPQ